MDFIHGKCFTCLNETLKMHSLTEMYDEYLDLGGLLKICLHCEINKPYMPKMLCETCLLQLKDFFSFKLRFINNEIMMKNRFGHQKEYDYINNNLKIESNEEDILFEVVCEEDVEEKLIPEISLQESDSNSEVKEDEDVSDEEERISNEPTDFRCPICKIFFMDSLTLESHLFKHKKHKCEVCGQTFIRKSYLTDHLTTHKEIKDILCPICSKAFKNRHTMRAHMKIHTNPRGFVCENCGKSFNQKGTLNTHLRLKHSEKRDYLCLWCGINFNLKASLDKHILRKHSSMKDRKVFKCPECPVEYLDKYTLDRHIKTKHSKDYKPVDCERCHKVFTGRGNLLRHKRTKHSEEIISDNCSKVKVVKYSN